MAIVSNPLIGKTKKSMGNVTFTTWKGINVLKDKAVNVANPKTPGQVLQRDKLRLLVAFYQYLSAAVMLGMKERAVKMSEYNAYVSANLRANAFDNSGGALIIDNSKLIIADGSLTPTSILSVSASESSGNATITFDPTIVGNQNNSDDLNVVLIQEFNETPETHLHAGSRDNGSVNVPLNAGSAMGDFVDVYVFFTRADGSKSSDSYHERIFIDA